MDQTQAQALLGRVFSEVIDGGDYTRIDEVFAPDFIDHSPMGDTQGHEAFTGMLDAFRAAMPGYRHEISDIAVLDDETLVWHVHVLASFTGEMMGANGQGQSVDLWVANAARVRDGRIVEHWGLGQQGLGRMLEQMGLGQPAAA
jgi:predicted ester cyclase